MVSQVRRQAAWIQLCLHPAPFSRVDCPRGPAVGQGQGQGGAVRNGLVLLIIRRPMSLPFIVRGGDDQYSLAIGCRDGIVADVIAAGMSGFGAGMVWK